MKCVDLSSEIHIACRILMRQGCQDDNDDQLSLIVVE